MEKDVKNIENLKDIMSALKSSKDDSILLSIIYNPFLNCLLWVVINT